MKFVRIIIILMITVFVTSCRSTTSTYQPTKVSHKTQNSQSKDYYLSMKVAKAAAEANNPKVVETALKKANTQRPNESEPIILLAEFYNMVGEYQKVASLVHENKGKFTKDPAATSELERQLGIAYWRLHQEKLALMSLLAAYSGAPLKNVVLDDIGILLDNLGNHVLAQSCYREGLKFAPDNDVLMNNYALSLVSTGQIAKAKKLFNHPSLIGSSNQNVVANRTLALSILDEANKRDEPTEEISVLFKKNFDFQSTSIFLYPQIGKKIKQICRA